MDKFSVSAHTKLVIFDLFGTLVKYGVMHHPFRQVLKWARDNGRCPEPDDARRLMTVDGKLTKLVVRWFRFINHFSYKTYWHSGFLRVHVSLDLNLRE